MLHGANVFADFANLESSLWPIFTFSLVEFACGVSYSHVGVLVPRHLVWIFDSFSGDVNVAKLGIGRSGDDTPMEYRGVGFVLQIILVLK
jgi:hypothetical protein